MFSLTLEPSLAHPPITTIALLSTAATAAKHLAEDNDPTLLYMSGQSCHTSCVISAVDVYFITVIPSTNYYRRG